MRDHIALADQVMLVMRTKYRLLSSKELPFDQAFLDVMRTHGIKGFEWHGIKVAIGQILSRRPRKTRAKATKRITAPAKPTVLTVLEDTRGEIVFLTSYGATLTMRRDVRGITVCTAHTDYCSDAVLVAAVAKAARMFTAHDHQAVCDYRVRVLRKTTDHLELKLANKYNAYVTQGKRGAVVMRVTLNAKPVAQSSLPQDIASEARGVAKQYFKGAQSGTLPGM